MTETKNKKGPVVNKDDNLHFDIAERKSLGFQLLYFNVYSA